MTARDLPRGRLSGVLRDKGNKIEAGSLLPASAAWINERYAITVTVTLVTSS